MVEFIKGLRVRILESLGESITKQTYTAVNRITHTKQTHTAVTPVANVLFCAPTSQLSGGCVPVGERTIPRPVMPGPVTHKPGFPAIPPQTDWHCPSNSMNLDVQ
jgi:hypothetical protein